jgi:anti-sigma factor ChrR (cupin superfamily)
MSNHNDDVTMGRATVAPVSSAVAPASEDDTLKRPSSPTVAPSIRVDANELPWRPTPYPGVEWKKLAFDARPPAEGGGASAVLLKFAPGATYGAHRHPRGEQYFVLEGSLEDGGQTWRAGSYVQHGPNSAHRPSSKDGCVLFVTLAAPIEILG